MSRPRITISATAAALALALVAAPASAHAGQGEHALARATGAVPTDVSDDADVAAPVSDDAHPVAPEVEVVDLDAAAVDSGAADPGSDQQGTSGPTDEGEPDSAEREEAAGADVEEAADGALTATFWAQTPELAIVGVSWDAGTAPEDLRLSWRTQTEAGWSDWEAIAFENEHDHGHGLDDDAEHVGRDGTDPLVAIDAVAVEVSIESESGTLPSGANLAVIDPGDSSADAADVVDPGTALTSPGGSGTGTGLVGTARFTPGVGDIEMAGGTARPTIYSRAQWGADESIMTWTPSQGRVQGATIHHTVNSNDYTSAQVPGIIRGIYAYHAQSWGRDWGDIGYNFLVDKFGRIWEGRSGGITAAPTGAHATGLNSNFVGISLIGNFDTTAVPAAAFTAVAKIAAWKLALHGITTSTGKVTVEAGTFNRVNGHRDSKSTTCPGRYIYDRLPELRTRIASYIGSFSARILDRDLTGNGYPDLVMRTPSGVSVVPTVDRATFNKTELGSGWSRERTVSVGDLDGNGVADLLLITGDGTLWFYPASSTGAFSKSTRVKIGWGWQSMVELSGGIDWNGDGRPDLIAKRSDGTLWLYANLSATSNGRSVKIGTSAWETMSQVSMVPAFNGGKPALLARKTSTGTLYMYPQTSSGGLGSRVSLGNGWAPRITITGVPDATGDGVGDLVSTDPQGRFWLYPGNGSGGITSSARQPIGIGGWQSTTLVLPKPGGSNELDFFTVRSNGTLWDYKVNVVDRAYKTAKPTGIAISSSDVSVFAAGDWTGDGKGDLMVIRANGQLILHAGQGGGTFDKTGTRIGTSWTIFDQVVAVGNWRGDGRPGLVGYQSSSGRLYYYQGDGKGGFEQPRIVISNGAAGMDLLAYAGRFNGAGVSDLIMRGADSKRLFLYDGNGPGLAMPPVVIGTGWGIMSNIVGVNDVTHDGKPDLIALTTSGQLRLYAGNGSGGYAAARTIATWPTDVLLG